jgi:hypothetical protein
MRLGKCNKLNWIHGLTYGLIYPAFFGNMVYDFILMAGPFAKMTQLAILEKGGWVWICEDTWKLHMIDMATGIFIILFFMVDFIHLNGTMNKIVPERRRSRGYLACDLAVTLFFFMSFVANKHDHHLWSALFLCFIPLLISKYKLENPGSSLSRKFFWSFSIPYYVIGALCVILFYFNGGKSYANFISKSIWLLVYVLAGLIRYSAYVFKYYNMSGMLTDRRFFKGKVRKPQPTIEW